LRHFLRGGNARTAQRRSGSLDELETGRRARCRAQSKALVILARDAYRTSRRQRKELEMLFAHLKPILHLDGLRLRGRMGPATSSSTPPTPSTSGSSPS
jgi:hypothetical protein